MQAYIAVMVGGAIGAFLRASVGAIWPVHPMVATWGINVVGCLVLGFFNAYAARSGRVPETVRLGFGTGVMGGFTTFSTFSVQGVTLMQHGAWGEMALYVLGSLLVGVAAAWLGTVWARKAVRV